jgi:hypothetical protein
MRALALLAAPVLACAPEQTQRDLCDEGLCDPGTLTWAVRAESFDVTTVDAVAVTPDEPPWFGGAWNGNIIIDDTQIPNGDFVGGYDGFLARTGVRLLTTLVSSMNASYGLRIEGLVPDPEDGAMLFAIGQQEDTRFRFEAAWYDRAGQEARRGTIAVLDSAGSLGGAAVAVDARGWPLVATSGVRIVVNDTTYEGSRAMILRVGQGLVPEILVHILNVDIADLAVAGDVVAIAGRYQGTPTPPEGSAPWPACTDPEPCGFVAALHLSTGLVTWVQPIRAPGGAVAHAVGIGGRQVVAMASAEGAPIDPPLGTGAIPAYLIALDADGNAGAPAVVDQTILAEAGTVIDSRDLVVTPSGEVIVALGFRGTVLVDRPRTFDVPDNFAGVVAELGTDLLWDWSYFITASTAVAKTLAVDGDQLAVGGWYEGTLVIEGDSSVPLPSPSIDVVNGFALELHR